MSHFKLRRMQAEDIAAVYQIQTQTYPPAMVESMTVLVSRLFAAPDTSWVADSELDADADDKDVQGICGYLFAYPSLRGEITRLGEAFLVPELPDCLYLHDLAIAPRAAGQGIGGALVKMALQHAQGLRYSCLVAVQSSSRFWQAQGYIESDAASLDQEQQACLATYVSHASYFVKHLGSVNRY